MRVDLQAPVAAETIAWEGIRPCTTVVVKATFRLDGNKLVFAEPRPISGDQTSRQGALRYPSDRVPWKAYPEILLVGHAKAVAPSSCIAASLQFGTHLHKIFFAMSGAPTAWVPLREKYLRSDRKGAVAVRVGPSSAFHPVWHERRLPPDINYSAFNSAPEDQRVSTLLPETPLVLEGLMAATNRLEVTLPSWQPRCLLSGSETVLSLVCDTLWFDVDEGVMQLVWRGLCPFQNEHATVIIGSDERYGGHETRTQERAAGLKKKRRLGAETLDVEGEGMRLLKALPFSNAVQEGALATAARTVSIEKAPVSSSGTGVFTLPTLGQGSKLGSTTGIGIKLGASQPLPFDTPSPQSPPEAEDVATPRRPLETLSIESIAMAQKRPELFPDDESTSISIQLPLGSGAGGELPFKPMPDASSDGELPFKPAPISSSDGELPFKSAPASAPPLVMLSATPPLSPNAGATVTYSLASVQGAALPFGADMQSPQPPTPMAAALAPPVIPAVEPVIALPPIDVLLKSQPKKSTVPARKRAPALPIAIVAAVKAALLDGVALKDVLLEHEVLMHKWHLNERRLVLDLARAAEQGDRQLAVELEAAIQRAASERARVQPALEEESDLDSYVAIMVELEEADDPRQVLRDLDMDAEQWQTLRRRWMRQTMRDPQLAAELRTKLKRQRCALRDISTG